MKFTCLVLVLSLAACTERNSEDVNESSEYLTNDTVPPTRKQVSKTPVASYMVPVKDALNKWYFGVDIYETPSTFKYLMRMQYEEVRATDTLNIPNFGTWPKVKINRGKDDLTCIIGFLDKKNLFKEYKMLTVKDDRLKLVVLKRYYIGITQQKAE